MQKNNCEVLILCGGEGKRLRSMISEIPKPMAPIKEKPFLDYLVRSIEKQGFKNFCFLVGYKSEFIINYFEKNFSHLNLRFSFEEQPLGTGGAIFKAVARSTKDHFLVLNGDTFFDIDLVKFSKNWKRETFKIALRLVSDSSRYGRVEINQAGRITSFIEKETRLGSSNEGLINGGIYLFDKNLFSPRCVMEEVFISLENEIFPELLKSEKIYSDSFTDDFIDIGIPEDYIRAKEVIEIWTNRSR